MKNTEVKKQKYKHIFKNVQQMGAIFSDILEVHKKDNNFEVIVYYYTPSATNDIPYEQINGNYYNFIVWDAQRVRSFVKQGGWNEERIMLSTREEEHREIIKNLTLDYVMKHHVVINSIPIDNRFVNVAKRQLEHYKEKCNDTIIDE